MIAQYKQSLLVFLLLFSSGNWGYLQSQAIELDTLFEVADSLGKEGEYVQSDSLCQILKDQSLLRSDWSFFYKSTLRIRKNGVAQGRHLAMIDSLQLYRDQMPDSLVELRNKTDYYIANIHSRINHSMQCIELYEDLIPRFRATGDTLRATSVIYNLGLQYMRIRDYQSALRIFKSGETLLENNKEGRYYRKMLIEKGKAQYYSQQFAEAKGTYATCLQLSNDSEYQHDVNYNIAEVYIAEDSLDQARQYLDLLPAAYSPIYVNGLMADLIEKEDQLVTAIDLSQKAVDLSVDYHEPRKHYRELVKLAIRHYKNGDIDASSSSAHSALAKYFDGIDADNLLSRPQQNDILNDLWMMEACLLKANYFLSKADEESNAIDEANYYFDLVFRMNDKVKSNYVSAISLYDFGAYAQNITDDILREVYNQYKSDPSDSKINRLIQVLQTANAYVLRNTVSERKALEMADVPFMTRNRFLTLKNALFFAEQNNNQHVLDSLLLPYRQLKNEIEKDYPKITNLWQAEISTIAKLQERLLPGQVILKYKFIKGSLLVVALNSSEVTIELIDLNEADYNAIDYISKYLASSDVSLKDPDYTSNSYAFFTKYVKPFLTLNDNQAIDQIIVVPDGKFRQIPFGTLITNPDGKANAAEDLLLSQYKTNYLYYLGQVLQPVSSELKNEEFVGFGIEYDDEYLDQLIQNVITDTVVQRSMKLNRLKYAPQEAMSLAELWDGSYYLNKDVTQENIIATIPNARIAHFAMHAITDAEDYTQSFMVLNDNEKSRFGYKEILTLINNPELVVLSVCQSNVGQDIIGEGAQSLSRMFINSGAESVLASQWNAPDNATKLLMEEFYRQLKKGERKSEALRLAQIAFLSNDDMTSPAIRSPYFWGGWTLYGLDSAIESKTQYLSYIGAILILMLVVMVIGLKRIKN